MRNLTFLIFIGAVFSECNSGTVDFFRNCQSSYIESDFRAIRDTVELFTIQIPEHFTEQKPIDNFKYVAFDTTGFSKDSSMVSITVEHYNLNGRSFNSFYDEIEQRTDSMLNISTSNGKNLEFHDCLISGRTAKVSVFGLQQNGLNFVNSQFYIKEKERIFVVSVGTTKNHNQANCLLRKSIESICGI